MTRQWISMLGLLMLAGIASGQTPEEAFERGNEAYRAGRFEEAIGEYSGIISRGYVSAPLYFNLGNAYYRTGRMAKAILSFERGARLDPGDPDIEFNLRLANLRIVDRIEPVPELFLLGWIRTLVNLITPSTSAVLLAVFWTLAFGQLAAVNIIVSSFWNALLRWGILAAAAFVLLLGLVFGMQINQLSDRSEAIVTARSVTAKNSPDTESVDAFVIHEGLKVRLSDSVGEWVKITLADGKVGWIRSTELERI